MRRIIDIEIKLKLSDNIALALACVNRSFITHVTSDSWGDSILLMEKEGNAFGRLYWFHDDNTTVYLDWLSVDAKIRQQGIGTKLQQIREEMGVQLGATNTCLWVKKDAWMHKWYKRRGYEDWKDRKENTVWMKKKLARN